VLAQEDGTVLVRLKLYQSLLGIGVLMVILVYFKCTASLIWAEVGRPLESCISAMKAVAWCELEREEDKIFLQSTQDKAEAAAERSRTLQERLDQKFKELQSLDSKDEEEMFRNSGHARVLSKEARELAKEQREAEVLL